MSVFKRPSFYMLCVIQIPEWKRRLIIPLPLFLVDEILALVPLALSVVRLTPAAKVVKKVDINKVYPVIAETWRTLRHSGPFTVVDLASGDGTRVLLKII